MREKWSKIIYEANKLAQICTRINAWSSTADIRCYVTAYTDFAEVHEEGWKIK